MSTVRRSLPRRVLRTAAVLSLGAGALTACGGDDAGSLEEAIEQAVETMPTVADTLVPGDLGTIPDVIPGVSEECTDFYNGWIEAMGSLGAATTGDAASAEQLSAYFASLQEVVPDDLADDVALMSEAFAQWVTVLADHGNDFAAVMADPEAIAAMEGLSSDEYVTATDNVSAYFDEVCGSNG